MQVKAKCLLCVSLKPQDQILRLAAPFRNLELFTGTPQWLGHGQQ